MRRGLCLLAGLGLACSDDTRALEPICDGSSSLRFGFEVAVSSGRLGPGEILLYDNGAGYLFVSGDCRYTVFYGANQWDEAREGTLSPDAEQELRNTAYYGAWDGLVGAWPGSGSVADAPIRVVFDEDETILCGGDCAGSTPAEVQSMTEEVATIAGRLWQEGTPRSGPMRILLLRFVDPLVYTVPLTPWPLSIPIAELAREQTDPALLDYGQGLLLEGEADVAAIRRLRADYRDGVHGSFNYRYLPFRDDEETGPPEYGLWARDISPFEDERGLVPIP